MVNGLLVDSFRFSGRVRGVDLIDSVDRLAYSPDDVMRGLYPSDTISCKSCIVLCCVVL